MTHASSGARFYGRAAPRKIAHVKVEVLLFASLKDAVGRTIAVEVPEPATVTSLRRALEAAHPVIARFGTRAKLAINEAWARETDPVAPGDTVALLPPVAGG